MLVSGLSMFGTDYILPPSSIPISTDIKNIKKLPWGVEIISSPSIDSEKPRNHRLTNGQSKL